MLAEARAAADALPSSPHELETACTALERLLGCLATRRPQLPVRDIKQSARVKFGTAARRRAVHRLSRSGLAASQVSILKAVNAVLRLCDVATHCLAVVSRQSVSSKSCCETAIALSTRLLTLAASLYEVQKVDTAPALSFFSSNSLRTALVAGAMHLGAIAVQHLEIEPMPWIHVANRIVMSNSTSAAPKTSVLSALFGGMIKAGKRYEVSERDPKAAEGALCLLSTLHVVLETDTVRETQGNDNSQPVESGQNPLSRQPQSAGVSPAAALGAGALSQAARSFLGERVVSAEEDGDEGRIAARTVYQACEEYAERAGECDGILGLLTRLFASAGRQCRLESAEDPVVSISEGTLLGQPDESDASSEGSHLRPDSPPFLIDVFDQRSNIGFGASATAGSASETGLDHTERIDLHREIGALALDTLAHWVSRSDGFQRYVNLDVATFSLDVCRSASFFSLGNTSASYDLRAAMADFGSLLGPLLSRQVSALSDVESERRWSALIPSLVSSCHRMNPVLDGIISYNSDVSVVKTLLLTFLERYRDDDANLELCAEGTGRLPAESLLNLLLTLISDANGLEVIEVLVNVIKGQQEQEVYESPVPYKASCLILLSHAVLVVLGIRAGTDAARIAFASLYNRDVDNTVDPALPQHAFEAEADDMPQVFPRCAPERLEQLKMYMSEIPKIIDRLCFLKIYGSWDLLATKAAVPREGAGAKYSCGRSAQAEKLYYHMFWSCAQLHKSVAFLSKLSKFNFIGLVPPNEDPCRFPLCSPFVCIKAMGSQALNNCIKERLSDRRQGSVILLYTAECLALFHPQNGALADDPGAFAQHSLSSLLISIVRNVVNIASDCISDDFSCNVIALQRAFRKNFSLSFVDAESTEMVTRRQFPKQLSRDRVALACLHVGMEYMRFVGTNELGQLLGNAMISSLRILKRLSRIQLEEVKCLILDVAEVLLFLPDRFTSLARSSFHFMRQLMATAFSGGEMSPDNIDQAILFISRIRGFGRILRSAAKSTSAIHLLCKFARDSSEDPDIDNVALEASFSLGASCAQVNDEVFLLLKESPSKVPLPKVLSMLLISEDDSAVAVSAHAQSLSLLTEACESSKHWHSSVLSSLNQIFTEDFEDFSKRLARRSIMQSATMYEGILAIFERVVGNGNGSLSSVILRKMFQATQILFHNEVDSTLESKRRLLSFAVRLSITDSRLFRRGAKVLCPILLEQELARLIVVSLERVTSSPKTKAGHTDVKETVLVLCGLLDCFLVGIYGRQFSFFNNSTGQKVSSKSTEKGSPGKEEDEHENTEEGNECAEVSGCVASKAKTSEDDTVKSSLCTYTSTGSQFVEQHWYFCYTCELAGSEGVCSVCARVCHDGCELAYSKFSRFFCDCGAGADPHHENASNAMSASEDGDGGQSTSHDPRSHSPSGQTRKRRPCKCVRPPLDSDPGVSRLSGVCDKEKPGTFWTCDKFDDCKLREVLTSELRSLKDEYQDAEAKRNFSIQKSFEGIIRSATSVRSLICTGLFIIREIDGWDVHEESVCRPRNPLDLSHPTTNVQSNADVFCSSEPGKLAVLSRLCRTGTVDVGECASSRMGSMNKSLVSFSPAGNVTAIGQKSGFVEFLDSRGFLSHFGDFIDKALATDYVSTSVSFDITCLQFHPTNANLLLVVGIRNVSILSRDFEDGSCRWNHCEIELGLSEYESSDGFNVLLGASWIEGETVSVLVTTVKFVKVFDIVSDVICPTFFAVLSKETASENPPIKGAADSLKLESEENGIVAATVIPRILDSSTRQQLFICVLTSNGKLFASRVGQKEEVRQHLSFVHNLCKFRSDKAVESGVIGLIYHPGQSLLAVPFADGALLCVSLHFQITESYFQASIRWMHLSQDVLPSGADTQLCVVPGSEPCFMFWQQGHTLKTSGVVIVTPKRSLNVQFFSGSPSASVVGMTAYSSSSFLGNPRLRGGFLILDDGGLYRLDLSRNYLRPQISEQTFLSKIVERRQTRSPKRNMLDTEGQFTLNAVPSSVGFFEKCRLVPDHAAIDVADNEADAESGFDRITVNLAGGGGDCVVSFKENEPFKFVASIDNQGIVLVGARILFGATERSKNRVPTDVKVFGRMVRWQSKNGMKRWLDIPFTVPESTASSQKVNFELYPRRSIGDNRTVGDGYCAIDALELYGVSNIEFTERKLFYENEKSKRHEMLRKQKEFHNVDKFKVHCAYTASAANDSRHTYLCCSPEQAAMLTTLNSIDSSKFVEETESASLLLSIGNLWSAVFEGSMSRGPQFLDQLLKPCMDLCAESRLLDRGFEVCDNAVRLLSQATKLIAERRVECIKGGGAFMHLDAMERSLFEISGISRSLLIAGCAAENFESGAWLKCYEECMPDSPIILLLLNAYLSLAEHGRSMLRSPYGSSSNVVDIYFTFVVKNILHPKKSVDKQFKMVTELVITMLCSIDQKLRLVIGQRLLELFDSPAAASRINGSPFESMMAASLAKSLSGPCSSDNAHSVARDLVDSNSNEDMDSSPRWAYRCDSCGEVCDQEWWHCNDCEDFDLCTRCLRKPNLSFDGPHKQDHFLLRGSVSEEFPDQEGMDENEKETSITLLSVQQVFGPLLDGFFWHVNAEKDFRMYWRFLDGAETIVQLIGKRSSPDLRDSRLKILFTSSYPVILAKECEIFGAELDSRTAEGTLGNYLPKNTCVLFLMLRILHCAQGRTTPTHLHSLGIPTTLFSLLRQMHGHLQLLARAVRSGTQRVHSPATDTILASWKTWNSPIAGLSYDFLFEKVTLEQPSSVGEMFQINEELGEAESIFLNLLLLALDALEYSYKSACSALISEQILSLPRSILCDVINFAESTYSCLHDSFLFKECALGATRLLSALSFENTDMLNDIIDKHRYEEQSRRLKRLLEDHAISTETSLEYDKSVEIAGIMSNLHAATTRHPATWRRFVIQDESVLLYLTEVAKALEGQIRVHALQLLAAGFSVSSEMASKVVKGLSLIDIEQQGDGAEINAQEDGDVITSGGSKGLSELVQAVRENEQVSICVFQDKDCHLFDFLVHDVMLKSQIKAARIAASHLLVFGILRAVKDTVNKPCIASIHSTLMRGIEMMPYAGNLADGLVDCVRFFILCCQADMFSTQSEPLLTGMALHTTMSLKHRCDVLVSHPNARLYGRLSTSLDVHGYFLESDPCMSCSATMCESSERRECRVDTIRAETKYTDCSIMHRLLSIHEVSAVSVKVIDPRRSRKAKSIDVSYSSRTVTDAAELKSAEHPWRKLRSLELGSSSTEACVDLVIPVPAANIKLEFTEFHTLTDVSTASRDCMEGESASNSGTNARRPDPSSNVNENLQCPRCSRPVTDRHGICRNCHENAYQCRQCRNINYENLDGFLCNECGYCKHARFEFSVTGRPTYVAERILNEEDRRRASKIIEKETGHVHRCMEQLTKLRSSIIRSLNSGVPTEEPREQTRLFTSGRVGLADILDSGPPRAEFAVIEALLEQGQAPQDIEERANSTQGGVSITEEVIAENSGSADPNDRDQNNSTASALASPVNQNNRLDQCKNGNNYGCIVSKTIISLAATYSKECRSIYATMSRGIRVLTMTGAELVRYANSVGGKRLQYANDIAGQEVFGQVDLDFSTLENDGFKIFPVQNRVACYNCTQSFISKCVQIVQTILRRNGPATLAIQSSDLAKNILLVCSLCEKSEVRKNIRDLITCLVNDNLHATQLICNELARKIEFCIDSFETVDSHSVARFEMAILEATAILDDSCWEERLKLVIRVLFKSSKYALTCSSVSESIILPCLRVALRLMRVDPDLSLIENTSLVEGSSVADLASHEGFQLQTSDNSEIGNDDLDGGVSVAMLRNIRDGDLSLNERSDSLSDHPRRSENFEETMEIGTLRSVNLMGGAINALADSQLFAVARDDVRLEERRNVQRLSSDFMSGSGAPSSIGTVVDTHLSDDEANVGNHRSESAIDIREINYMLERDHDSRLLSADVNRWLEGKLDQASWIAEMKERSVECERKEKETVLGEAGAQQSYLKLCFQRWRNVGGGQGESLQSSVSDVNQQFSKGLFIEKDNWVVRLMLFTPCATVRKEACALLELICGQEESLQLQLLDVLTGPALSLGADVGEKSKEFFDLLETTLSASSHRLYLIANGFLPRLAALIRTRAERLIMSEANTESSLQLVNFLEGYSLKRLLSLLRQTLDAIPSQRENLRERLFKADNHKLVWSLQRAYVCVRKLISLRTRLTDECGSQVCEMLLSKDFLFMGPTVTAVVSACVSELRAAKRRNDAQAIAILLEQLCQMLCPERKEPICFLSLNKAPTQEEFIRGSMSRNPYPSSSFDGPLMRDVKNKICKDLDLPGLLEDDFAMELLVAGNLVKLDLPIMAVHDHVWRGSAAASLASNMQPTQVSRASGLRRASQANLRGIGSSRSGNVRSTILTFRRVSSERDTLDDDVRAESRTNSPMVVVYRLSGLDGEATEPIVDSVPVENSEDQNGEELYRDTVIFGEVGGFEVLFELLTIVGSWGDDVETAVRVPALRLLRASCEVAQNRTLLAKSQDAVRTLLDCAASAFEHAQGSPTAVISAESLLIAAEQILAQQRKELETHSTNMSDTVSLSPHDPEEVISRIQVFLGRLSMATSPKAEHSILHLLPFLIQGVPGAIDVALAYFHFSWDAIDLNVYEQQKAKQLGTVLLATPHDLRGDKFAEHTIRAEVGRKAVDYIIKEFPIPRSENKVQWEVALDNPGPPLVLRLITGLSLFFGSRQKQQVSSELLRAILREQAKIIPVLCQLEMAVSGNAIGTTTEELLDAMAKDLDIKKEINIERKAIKRARREAANASRTAILQETGLVRSVGDSDSRGEHTEEGQEGIVDQEPSVLDLMRDLPDEVGPSCVVCGDGFRCRPEEALAFYVYCRRVPLDLSNGSHAALGRKVCDDSSGNAAQGRPGHVDLDTLTSGRSRIQSGTSSRSGTNCCYTTVTQLNAIHLSCHKEAARVDRTSRRDEWDGAFLRNSQTKCNNLFPVRPPVTCKLETGTEDEAVLKQARMSYTAAVENYFSRLSSLGRTNLPHSKAVTYDIGRGLLRFADGGTTVFSEHARGGGPHSNACFIPGMVTLSIYILQSSIKGDTEARGGLTDNKSVQTQGAALEKFLNEEEVGDITYYLASSLILYSLNDWKCRRGAFLRRGLNDAMLSRDVLLRLIVFTDLVNRVLKSGIRNVEAREWLDVFCSHIGTSESFGLEFGDSVNRHWELHIRKVEDKDSFVEAMRQNAKVCGEGDEDECEFSKEEEARYVEVLDKAMGRVHNQ